MVQSDAAAAGTTAAAADTVAFEATDVATTAITAPTGTAAAAAADPDGIIAKILSDAAPYLVKPEMPFTKDCGGVTGISHVLRKERLAQWHAKGYVCSYDGSLGPKAVSIPGISQGWA